MNLFGLFRTRGDLSAPGPHIVAGVIQPSPDNIVNLEYYRLSHGNKRCVPPRGTRVTPDASHPTQPSDSAGRPVPTASRQSGTPNPLVSSQDKRRSVSQPGLPDTTAPAAPQHSEGA